MGRAQLGAVRGSGPVNRGDDGGVVPVRGGAQPGAVMGPRPRELRR
jgi:hypothetical protein